MNTLMATAVSARDSNSEIAASPVDAENLAEAFRIFSQASEELTAAYSDLQAQVTQLTRELAAANGELRQQYLEKAALTERLTLLLDALPAGVVVLDGAGRVVQANPAAAQFLGSERIQAGWSAIRAAMQESDETPEEVWLDGRRLAVAVTRLDSAGGRIALLHDVTEANQLKTRAERNQRLAAMGEMAAQVAHQLRTPLAAALLYAGNLENPDLSDATRISIAQKTVARLKHLEHLIQDMLLFARGEVLGREAFAVSGFLAELGQTFEPLATQRGIDFAVEATPLGEAENEVMLVGNRKSLVGALTSLIENALQAVDGVAGGGQVRLSATRQANQLCLTVRDNGPGMAPEIVGRLFEPFYTTRAEGTGLGLAIARGVARAHGGVLEVSSTPGLGTEFILSLPLASYSPSDPQAADNHA